MEDKEYYNAYKKASQDGEFINAFIRIIFAGPPNVGKTSIRNIFTQLGLSPDSSATQIAEISDKMFDIVTYNIVDGTKCDFRKILNRKIIAAIELFLQHPDSDISTINQLDATEYQATALNMRDDHGNALASLPYQQHEQSDNDILMQSISSLTIENHSDVSTTSISNLTIVDDTFYDQSTLNSNVDQFKATISQLYRHIRSELHDQTQILDQQFGKLLDFGGQPMYHITHRPFMSANSIYILVFNITQDIHQPVQTRDGKCISMTYLEVMQEWLTSITGSNNSQNKIVVTIDDHTTEYSLPIVILVASHGDCVKSEEVALSKFIQFEKSLISYLPIYKSNIYSSRIIFNGNPNDKTEITQNHRRQCCQKLHGILNRFTNSLPFMGRDYGIPIRWYIIAAMLHLAVNDENDDDIKPLREIKFIKVNKIMQFNDIKNLTIKCGLYENDAELRDMFLYLHDIGEVIFCHTADNNGIIVIDVNWFLKILRDIIQLDLPKAGSLDIISRYFKVHQTGKMSKDYIIDILNKHQTIQDDQLTILELLEYYDIICKIESDNEAKIEYFAPYLLHPEVKQIDLSKFHVSDKLYIGYKYEEFPYIPDGIFYCLLTSCLKKWNDPKVKLYHQCIQYFLKEDYHFIIVKKEKSHISLQYCYQKFDNPQSAMEYMNAIENSITKKRPHDFIKDKLSKIVKSRMPKFEQACSQYYVECSKCRELTIIKNSKSYQTNLIFCGKCRMVFNSKSIHDWMMLNQKRLLGKQLF